jgi:hypothetical protein
VILTYQCEPAANETLVVAIKHRLSHIKRELPTALRFRPKTGILAFVSRKTEKSRLRQSKNRLS